LNLYDSHENGTLRWRMFSPPAAPNPCRMSEHEIETIKKAIGHHINANLPGPTFKNYSFDFADRLKNF